MRLLLPRQEIEDVAASRMRPRPAQVKKQFRRRATARRGAVDVSSVSTVNAALSPPTNFRRNENHRISKRLVAKAKATACVIVLEDLKGIRERVTVRGRQRAK